MAKKKKESLKKMHNLTITPNVLPPPRMLSDIHSASPSANMEEEKILVCICGDASQRRIYFLGASIVLPTCLDEKEVVSMYI